MILNPFLISLWKWIWLVNCSNFNCLISLSFSLFLSLSQISYPESFLKTSVVSNVFTLSVDTIDSHSVLGKGVITILIDNTLGSCFELLIGNMVPPVFIVTILVKLSTTIIKTVSNFMTNNKSNGTKVEVAEEKLSRSKNVIN